jgi:uncharacterized membrane protein
MSWWRRETFRQVLPLPLALAALLVPGETLVKVLAFWDVFALGYLLLTWLAHRGLTPAQLRAAVTVRERPALRWITSSPEQLPQAAAAVAMVATVIALPRFDELGGPPGLVMAIGIVAVVTAWVALQTGFALAYAARDTRAGGLDFPGADEPGPVDYAYFSVAIGTAFTTSDVAVTRSPMRRLVLVHSVTAFFFNAMIVASAVGFVTTRLSA